MSDDAAARERVPMRPSVESGEEAERQVCRPGLGRWLWYCFGGRLPEQHHTWVLRDVTCRTWALRHFARWMVGIVPVFCLFLAFMPSSFGVRLLADVTICGGLFVFALVNIFIDTDRRAVRAGYSFKLPGEIRSARAVNRQRLANHERRERLAARQARRRG